MRNALLNDDLDAKMLDRHMIIQMRKHILIWFLLCATKVFTLCSLILRRYGLKQIKQITSLSSTSFMFYAEGIESTGIRPYYIYLYRDGRDVALSFQKAIVGEKHIYALAQNWKKDQEEAFRLRERTNPDHFYMLSYEMLTANPVEVMQQLCDFLHLPYTDKVMEYYKSRESQNTAVAGTMWANVTKPIMLHTIPNLE